MADERRPSEMLGDLLLWELRGSSKLWARSQDVALLMEVDRSNISVRISDALRRKEIRDTDARRGVKDSDVAREGEDNPHTLTTAPGGILMLNTDAIRRLAMTCRGARGVAFRNRIEQVPHFSEIAQREIAQREIAQPRAALDAERETEIPREVALEVSLGMNPKCTECGRRLENGSGPSCWRCVADDQR